MSVSMEPAVPQLQLQQQAFQGCDTLSISW